MSSLTGDCISKPIHPVSDMSKKYSLLLTVILFSCTAFCQQNFADKIYYNAVVYTCDPANAWVKAIAVKDDKIIYAGNDYAQYKSTSTKLIDLHQQLVLP